MPSHELGGCLGAPSPLARRRPVVMRIWRLAPTTRTNTHYPLTAPTKMEKARRQRHTLNDNARQYMIKNLVYHQHKAAFRFCNKSAARGDHYRVWIKLQMKTFHSSVKQKGVRWLSWMPPPCILTDFNEAYVFLLKGTWKCLASQRLQKIQALSSSQYEIAVRSVTRAADRLIRFVKYFN